jgi:RNA polymerase sigma-70 factor (ECF subfamily)
MQPQPTWRTAPSGDPADGLALLRGLIRAHRIEARPVAVGDATLSPPGEAAARVPTRPSRAPSAASPTGPPAIPAGGDGVTAIVARAQAGDAEAFGELYDRYVDVVFRYVYYRVGNKPQTEDFVSETFLRALRRIGSFTWQGKDFAAWLITIARNLIADHYKSGRYRLEVTTADMLDADRVEAGPEDLVLDALTNATLVAAVRKLAGEQQECIVLRFLQGMSVSETALAMGKTDGAIKALQYRAVRSLSRLLPPEMVL